MLAWYRPKICGVYQEAILKLVRGPEAARPLGKRGQERMLAMTPESYGAQLQKLLSELR
jgi:hypothetical protein